MYLYHYSSQPHTVLKTLRAQGHPDAFSEKYGPDYGKHISFFFERPPLAHLGALFENQHPFWYAGHKVFEHQVVLEQLKDFRYHLVESPEVMALFYDPKSDRLSDEAYFKKRTALEEQNGYQGTRIETLKKAIQKNKGQTRAQYLALPQRPNFEKIRLKYAATVPHLMLYPESGLIAVQKIEPVIIGNEAPALETLKSDTSFLQW